VSTEASELPDKLEHCQQGDHDSRQCCSEGNKPDGFFLELIEPVAERSKKLALYPIVAVFSSNNDLQGEQTAVECRQLLARVLAT
jgi:hypothetical protein